MLGLSGTLSYAVFVYCVFVYLCICIFVFALLTHGNIIFDILEQSSFQKYTTWWVFLALCNMLYLCICVFVYLCICIWVGKVSTRPIWPKNASLLSSTFLFERPKLRYVLKTVLHCKGSQISCTAITRVSQILANIFIFSS